MNAVDRVEQLSNRVLRLELRTPTLPPATATNTLIIGASRLAVIEPATPFEDEQRILDTTLDQLAAEGRHVEIICITHHHVDHIGYVEALRQRLSVPVCAHAATAARVRFEVDRELADGDMINLGDGVQIEATHTPGHAPGHLVYRERQSGLAHVGDMVAGEGTILVDPEDDGDMIQYLDSLRRLKRLGCRAFIPAHGPVLKAPEAVVDHYIKHRLGREAKILAAIEGGAETSEAIVARAYDDAPQSVWPWAMRAMQAHLIKLERDGRIKRDGDRIRPTMADA